MAKISKENAVKWVIYALCASFILMVLLFSFTGRSYSVKPCEVVPAPESEYTKLNLNTADFKELESLDGIGPVSATKIIRYRQKHGSFKNIEELSGIEGFKGKLLEKIKSRVKVEEK